jgi:hypothetical protein
MFRNDRVNKKTTSFFYLLGLTFTSLINTFSFYFAAACSVLLYFLFINVREYSDLINYVSNTIASISATILGIVIAGLAILITLTQGKLLGLFLQKNILQKFLFPFWIVTGMWAISTLLCVVIKLVQYVSFFYIHWLFAIETFVFIYSMFSTVSLMGHSIRMGIYVASLQEND